MTSSSLDALVLHRRALAVVDALLVDVEPQDLARPTPCEQWDLRALLEHVVGQNDGLALAVRGGGREQADWDPRPLGDNPAETVAVSAGRLVDAFAEDGALRRSVWMPEIQAEEPLPAEVAVRIHLLDTVVHAWDIAQSLERTVTFDDAVLEVASTVAAKVPDGPDRQAHQAPFAPPVMTPEEGGELTRLVAWLGRSPLKA